MNYPQLIQLLNQPDYAGLSDEAAVALANQKRHTATRSRFGSFRTMGSMLTPEEYTVAKTILVGASSQSVLVADMVEMLKQPGDEQGNRGGLDFGDETFRGMCEQLLAEHPAIVTKIKAYAEVMKSDLELNGLPPIRASHVQSARELMEAANGQ